MHIKTIIGKKYLFVVDVNDVARISAFEEDTKDWKITFVTKTGNFFNIFDLTEHEAKWLATNFIDSYSNTFVLDNADAKIVCPESIKAYK